MNKSLKVNLILCFIFFESFFYVVQLLHNVNISDLYPFKYIFFLFLLYFIYIICLLIKTRILYPSIIIKLLLFTIFITMYFIVEINFLKLYMYSIGGSGGYIRNNIYDDIDHIFTVSEVLYWNFIFSLHYPIYIFIFIKPFVNHLDKSIKKIRKSKEVILQKD